MNNDVTSAHAHDPDGDLDPKSEEMEQHAFLMLGKKSLFVCHMTMFDHEGHCYQMVLRVTLPDATMKKYREALGTSRPVPGGALPETLFLANSAKDLLSIPQLQSGRRRSFLADIYQGVPSRPKSEGWPWSQNDVPDAEKYRVPYLLVEDCIVEVDRIVYARHFDFGLERPRKLTYVLFGEGDEAHMTNYQVKDPDFDHVLSLEGAPGWLPKSKLEPGIQVSFDIDSKPADGLVHCSNPLSPGRYPVHYQGQGTTPLEVNVAKTWWCSAAIVNKTDPCTAPSGGGAGQGGGTTTMASQITHPNRDIWYAVFGAGHPELKKYQEFNLRLPSPPRCKLCYAPYGGVGKVIMKLQNRAPSSRNPLFCSRCDEFLRKFPGGAEVEMTIVFLDVRGSSRLAENMPPAEFSLAMQSFYNNAFPVLNAHDGFIIDVRGDGALVTFPPGFSGPDHASKAIEAVTAVLGLPILAPDGSILELGAGVHTGVAYIGTMTGKGTGVEDITVLGDAPNVASHLCSVARPGEALVSEAACAAGARLDHAELEHRDIAIKERRESIKAYVVTTS